MLDITYSKNQHCKVTCHVLVAIVIYVAYVVQLTHSAVSEQNHTPSIEVHLGDNVPVVSSHLVSILYCSKTK